MNQLLHTNDWLWFVFGSFCCGRCFLGRLGSKHQLTNKLICCSFYERVFILGHCILAGLYFDYVLYFWGVGGGVDFVCRCDLSLV